MPIKIKLSELEAAAAKDRKQRGILDEIPEGCFTVRDVATAFKLRTRSARDKCHRDFRLVGRIRTANGWECVYAVS
jgi:hypothetical protein